MIKFDYEYLPFYRSQKTTDRYWTQLSQADRKRVNKCLEFLSKTIGSAKEKDVVYSMVRHVLESKVNMQETQVVVKQYAPVYVDSETPVQKNTNEELTWDDKTVYGVVMMGNNGVGQ